VELVITKLDDGQLRVAEIGPDGKVIVHEWVQRRSCCSFACADSRRAEVGPFEYLDRLELKRDYERRGVRVVPGPRRVGGVFSVAASS
jgi:2,3,4,5-tetrahydropyridine-2-carboxylate N-succinyltransferase